MKKRIISFVFILVFIFVLGQVSAIKYVRAGSSGNGDNWATAYGNLPADLTRGETYYLADGSYGGYTFDDPGSALITIKKATQADHGTETGWLSTYGNGQAAFGGFSFDASNYLIEGNTRNQSDWSDGSKYGITVSSSSGSNLIILDPGANSLNLQNIRINKTYMYYTSFCNTDECWVNHHFAARYGGGNLYLGYSLIENVSWGASIKIDNVNGFTIENNYFRNIVGKELISAQATCSNVIFRNNFIKNVGGAMAIGTVGNGSWEIYNNVFWSPDSRFTFSDGRIIGNWIGQGVTTSNKKIYGNTFYDVTGNIGFDAGTGNEARNNLFIGFSPGFTNVANSNNLPGASTALVVNANGGNFHLVGPTTAGATLAAPFNTDIEGTPRGNGVWDIGAYEYASGPDTTPPSVSSSGPSGTVTTSSATLSVSTNEMATCRYSTTSGQAFSSMTNFASTSSTSHSQSLSGLTDGVKNYYVKCQDSSSNTMVADHTITFTVSISTGGTGCTGTCYYVRQGATGTGSDWNNAYGSLPLTLQRGATYYVAGGSYVSYTFNTTESGTTKITVKKASVDEHGTDTGWQESYGTTQAVFSSFFNIQRGYFEINGSYRNESNWFNGSRYGFKIQNTGNWQHMRIMNPSQIAMPNVTVAYIYIAAIIGSLPSGCNNHCTSAYGPCAINTNTENQNVYNTGYVFSHMYVEGSNNPYFLRFLDDPVLEYSATEKTTGSTCWHGDTVNLYYSNRGSGIVRYNHFRDQYLNDGSTGVIVFSESTGGEVYGNIFDNVNVGNGVIAADWPNDNLKIHHNTFVDTMPYSDRPVISFPTGGNTGTGNVAYNNLRYNTDQITFVGGTGVGANNTNDSSNVFVSYANGDFRLARATTLRGGNLAAPYNKDMFGFTRGGDGFWDVGAFEFGGVTVPINGDCGASANTCDSPAAATGINPNATHYRWTCPGANGGSSTQCTMAIPVAKFVIGDRVYVSSSAFNLWIRDSPAGAYLGEQPFNALGTVVGGPTDAALSGEQYRWWNVDFDTGVDGWTVEGYLEKYVTMNYHPADSNGNLVITNSEASVYINAYFTGSNSITESLYALTLVQAGGSYAIVGNTNCAVSPWLCWISN